MTTQFNFMWDSNYYYYNPLVTLNNASNDWNILIDVKSNVNW